MSDSLDRLWSPWRSEYIESFASEGGGGCVFCDALASSDDDARYVVWRGKTCFAILNRFPYNAGHILIVPNRHLPSLEDLTTEEDAEVMASAKRMMRLLTETMHPQGFNFGANVGRVSGAGMADHVHFHVVPRWNGDTNFMPVVGGTKVISEELAATYRKLKEAVVKK